MSRLRFIRKLSLTSKQLIRGAEIVDLAGILRRMREGVRVVPDGVARSFEGDLADFAKI